MKKLIILTIFILLLIPISFAYYPGESTYIGALYTENSGAVHANANLTITSPSNVVLINNIGMTEYSTGSFNYLYTFPENVTGAYKMKVDFYNDSWGIQGTSDEDYYVSYNYTEDIDTLVNVTDVILNITTETKSLVENIWDFIQTKLLGNYEYNTEIIGKPVLYNQILFKTTANYVLTNCEILINTNTYNMSLSDKFAYYDYYIENDGLYNWEVNCE